VRDSRIALIYEGTNEIQAIDLVMRKLLDSPRRSDALLAEIACTFSTSTKTITPSSAELRITSVCSRRRKPHAGMR
jgi:hypothetical protein